jgi:hypothetical protein
MGHAAFGQLGSTFRGALGVDSFRGPAAPGPLQSASREAAPAERHLGAIIDCGVCAEVDRAEDEEILATRTCRVSVGVMACHAVRRRVPFFAFSSGWWTPLPSVVAGSVL